MGVAKVKSLLSLKDIILRQSKHLPFCIFGFKKLEDIPVIPAAEWNFMIYEVNFNDDVL